MGSFAGVGNRNLMKLTKYFCCQRKFSTRNRESKNKLVNNIKKLQLLKSGVCEKNFEKGKYMVFSEQSVLLSKNDPLYLILWGSFEGAGEHVADVTKQSVLLSVSGEGNVHFAVRVPVETRQAVQRSFGGEFVSLRTSLFLLSSADSALVSQGWSLLSWGVAARFCEACGGALATAGAGGHKRCSGCGAVRYPSLSPVGIALVTSEDRSRALLVRQHAHPPGMFTCIAGFVEVGESVEENVRREVAEEVGLEAKEIEYVGSQHWALPASRLMIGCIAVVTETEFSLDETELEAAAWCTPREVRNALTRVAGQRGVQSGEPGHMWVPPRGAIAHHLLQHWLTTYHAG
ncbi:NAD(P)H pyrophosphatase NUDT13, mitochondrial-like [Bacillus rossius redtenbacheri]|uniref:NAD(P)H pyrophosphatase NUDT13, mitochondrial-like n=1 Tax=Bacillus rossius redtenbacheri TaxID=93214 RepID=UPI002FDDC760